MIQTTYKQGIAMIELIFAIVVIGIVLLSAPMLIQQSINSSFVATQQESIAVTASHMGLLLTKHWDEADANQSSVVAPIIFVNRAPFQNASLNGVKGRNVALPGEEVPPTALGLDDNESKFSFDDVDDADGLTFSLTTLEESMVGDYLDRNITISTSVRFAEDQPLTGNVFTSNIVGTGNALFGTTLPSGTNTNIKLLQVTLTTDNEVNELNKTITMYAFSCNIGTYSLKGGQF